MTLKKQYIIGLLLNLVFLGIMYCIPITRDNVKAALGENKCYYNTMTDLPGYVALAKNYLEYGTFGTGNNAECTRQVGFPFIIAMFIQVFGEYWLIAMQIFQCFLFALFYPVTTLIAREFGLKRTEKYVFIFMCVFAIYYMRVPLILTDGISALFFIIALLYGMKFYRELTYQNLLMYLLFCTLAMMIRPIYMLLPILNLAIAYYRNVTNWIVPIGLSVVILFLVNISTVRNYVNQGFLAPSNVVGINAMYLGGKILRMSGENEYLAKCDSILLSIKDINVQNTESKKKLFEVIKGHPVETFRVISGNIGNVMLNPNPMLIMSYFGMEYDRKIKNQFIDNPTFGYGVMFFIYYLLILVYLIISIMFIISWLKSDVKTKILIAVIFAMILFPAFLMGSSGDRLRLPIQSIILIFAFSNMDDYIQERIDRFLMFLID